MNVLASHFFRPKAEHLRRRPVDKDAEAMHIDPVDALARRFEQQARPCFGLPQSSLSPPLGVDVGVYPDPLSNAAPLFEDGNGPDEHVPVLAVALPQPVFHLVEGASGHGRGPDPRGVLLVVGVDGIEPARKPLSWSNDWPVNSVQPGCSASNWPDAGVFQTIAAVASIRDPEAFLLLRIDLFGPLRLGDISGDAERSDDAAVLISRAASGSSKPR